MLNVGPNSLVVADAEGEPQCEINVFKMAAAGDRHGILLWGIFTQLIQINRAFGSYDHKARTGSGLAGMLGQQTISAIETAERVGLMLQAIQDMQAQADQAAAAAPTASSAMGDVLKIMKELGVDVPEQVFAAAGKLDAGSGGNGADSPR